MPVHAIRHPPPAVRRLGGRLRAWFSTHARGLPWRRTRDPYGIWVSEIMLQQTQVKTVIPYWERWMRELPTIAAAAKAPPAKLHKLWEGLGYYTRVRNLQRAAQEIVVRHGGKFPTGFDDMLALPGIGRYTAGAICSIAFNQPTPILDGNVMRVLTRIFGITTDPREKKTNARLWRLAEELVSYAARSTQHAASKHSRTRTKDEDDWACSHLNQSLMELGAVICTPRAPKCNACPITGFCVARQRGWQEQLPKPNKASPTTPRRFVAFIIERDGELLVRQRPPGVVNAQLWEFPNVEVMGPGSFRRPDPRAATRRPKVETAPLPELRLLDAEPFITIKHSITRYRITLEARRAQLANGSAEVTGRWLAPRQLHRLAFTGAHKKILRAATADGPARKSGRRQIRSS